jgi:putative transposase
LKKHIFNYILKNIPHQKSRGWIFKLVWKAFRKFKSKDVLEIWDIYRKIKNREIEISEKTVVKAMKTEIRGLSKDNFQRLKELSHASKNLYNQALYIVKEEFEKNQKYIGSNQIDKIIKNVKNLEGEINYRKLKAKVSQQTLRRLDSNFMSYFSAVTDWRKNPKKHSGKPKPPNFLKSDFYSLIYNYQAFQIVENRAILEIKSDLYIKIPQQILGKKIKQIEISFKFNQFEAIFHFEEIEKTVKIEKNNNIASIDLGVNNFATVVSNGTLKPFIINGRPLKSINQFYNKNYAKYSSKLTEDNQAKWSNRLQIITDKRNNKIRDFIHKATNLLVEKFIENSISMVLIGNLTNALNGINLGKRNNQNISTLPFGQFTEILKYKLETYGIKVQTVDESYTSKASFIDSDELPEKYSGEKHSFSGRRVKRGLYKSKDGILLNADVNGAFNILRKAVPNFRYFGQSLQPIILNVS